MQLSKHFYIKRDDKFNDCAKKRYRQYTWISRNKKFRVTYVMRFLNHYGHTLTNQLQSPAATGARRLCEAIGSKKTSQHAKGQAVDLEIFGVPNIKTAYWLQNNVDFDQLIMEYYDKDDPAGGWVHISYHESDSNRKQVLTFDGKKYTEGLPDMEWKDGKVVS